MALLMIKLSKVLLQEKDEAQITSQETKILEACELKSTKEAVLGSTLTGALVILGTKKLNKFFRTGLATGAVFFSGLYFLDVSLGKCALHILSMEGTRMKHELEKIILREYGNDPNSMRFFSKHFFLEEILDDSVLDQSKRMYRAKRTFIEDSAAHIQRSVDTYGCDEYGGEKKINNLQQEDKLDNNIVTQRKAAGESKEISVVTVRMQEGDFLDFLYGYSDDNKDVLHPNSTSNDPAKHQTRRKKRLHHRRRLHHQRLERGNASNADNA